MGKGSMFVVFLSVTVGAVLYILPELHTDPEPPQLADEYFGRGIFDKNAEFPADKRDIKKFAIKIEESVLTDLKSRLNRTRYLEPLDNVQFQYGFHTSFLKEVVNYWLNKYDWRKQEKELNKFAHFKTQIEGIDVHFIHHKPQVKGMKVRVFPLLLIHGWPGSVAEFTKILPILTTPTKEHDFVFEVICPSIPGYGFSEAPHQAGFGTLSAARVFVKLMDRLGYEKFYLQGGDWGSIISAHIAKIYPTRIIGMHVNMAGELGNLFRMKYLLGHIAPGVFGISKEEYPKIYPYSKLISFLLEESGYAHLHATKPDTVGAALIDSPSGLAAYILEKFYSWTYGSDNQPQNIGDLTRKFTMDELLTNVMIYWSTNTIASSMRLYKEHFRHEHLTHMANVPVQVPTGLANFPNDLLTFPKSQCQTVLRNLVRFTTMPRGGHFAAMEEPQLLADEVFAFAKDVEDFLKKNEKEEV